MGMIPYPDRCCLSGGGTVGRDSDGEGTEATTRRTVRPLLCYTLHHSRAKRERHAGHLHRGRRL